MWDEPYCEDDSNLPFEEFEEYKLECKCPEEECECMDWDEFVLYWIDRQADNAICEEDYA